MFGVKGVSVINACHCYDFIVCTALMPPFMSGGTHIRGIPKHSQRRCPSWRASLQCWRTQYEIQDASSKFYASVPTSWGWKIKLASRWRPWLFLLTTLMIKHRYKRPVVGELMCILLPNSRNNVFCNVSLNK